MDSGSDFSLYKDVGTSRKRAYSCASPSGSEKSGKFATFESSDDSGSGTEVGNLCRESPKNKKKFGAQRAKKVYGKATFEAAEVEFSKLKERAEKGSETETESSVAKKIGGATKKAPKHTEGLSKAKKTLKNLKDDAIDSAFERQLRSRAFRKEVVKPVVTPSVEDGTLKADLKTLGVSEIKERALKRSERIVEIALKSGNLKGDFIRDLKVAAKDMREMVNNLSCRSVAEETRRLQADNSRMKAHVAELEKELKALRREFSERTSPSLARSAEAPPTDIREILRDFGEELKGGIMSSVGIMMDAKMAGIQDRLLPAKILRPPLASSQASAVAGPSRASTTSVVAAPPKQQEKKGKKSPQTGSSAVSAQKSAPTHTETPSAPQNEGGSWATVVRKGKGKGKKTAPTSTPVIVSSKPVRQQPAVAGPSSGPKLKKLTPPRSSAVVITLQKEASERGVTYGEAIATARGGVALSDLGIDQIRIRQTAAGARIIEIPGSQTADKADRLAEKLRGVLADVARVNRPQKLAELQISGLDDSVVLQEVISAVAAKGGCAPENIKAGPLRPGSGGSGSVNLQCPIVAAKKLIEGGRLLIGWSSARVRQLEARPMRCYKCLGVGHTWVKCPSSVDRSGLCYRCGREGHKSPTCTAEPRCAVCSDAGKPANHVMGGRTCNPPPNKKTAAPTAKALPTASPVALEVNNMSE